MSGRSSYESWGGCMGTSLIVLLVGFLLIAFIVFVVESCRN